MTDFEKYPIMPISMKGGSGKSAFANALLNYLRSSGVPVAAYDADGAVGSLSSMHAQRDAEGQSIEPQCPLEGVVDYNIRDNSRDMLINSLKPDHKHVLHDLAGGALVEIQRATSDQDGLKNFFRVLRDVNACAVFFHLITPDDSTVESVAMHLDLTDRLSEDLKAHCRHVAVFNLQGERSVDDFPVWYGYRDDKGLSLGGETRKRLLNNGGVEMAMPSLNERTMSLLKALHVPFSVGQRDSRLLLADQQRIRNFTEDFEAALTPEVRALMGLST